MDKAAFLFDWTKISTFGDVSGLSISDKIDSYGLD
jgi:hypothetical protein